MKRELHATEAASTRAMDVVRALPGRSAGRPLEADVRAQMQAVRGHDFGAVRIHTDGETAAATRRLGARAVTVGSDVGFAQGRYAPQTEAGRRLLVHELVHSVQQQRGADMNAAPDAAGAGEAEAESAALATRRGATAFNVAAHAAPGVPQFDRESRGRLAEVHERLFVGAPGGGTRRTWRAASGADRGTEGELFDAFRRHIDAMRVQQQLDATYIPERTTEAEADADALAVDQRIRDRFPFITSAISAADITRRVQRFGSARGSDVSFVRQWVENRLAGVTDLTQYALAQRDLRLTALVDSILADPMMGRYVPMLAVRVAAFHEEDADTGERNVFLNIGMPDLMRVPTLIHELTHFYVHPRFNDWVAATGNEDFYGEGFTEYLARLVMTEDERGAARSSYQDRFEAVRDEVALNVPDDDIARAYFQGEVWRLETRSTIARGQFTAASGIRADATEREEAVQSRAGPGISQEVVPDAHYRFLNLGHDRAEPKAQHVEYFRRLKSRLLDPQPATAIRFVGHASSPGTWAHNDRLSLQRAVAFYRMARDQGVPDARLRDAGNPPHHGEHVPTLTEEDAQTRAFNRRVELLVTGAARTPGASAGSRSAPAIEREEER